MVLELFDLYELYEVASRSVQRNGMVLLILPVRAGVVTWLCFSCIAYFFRYGWQASLYELLVRPVRAAVVV